MASNNTRSLKTIDDCLSIREHELFVEEVSTIRLAAEFGTPLFVISEDQVRRNYRRIHRAFQDYWPEGPVNILPSLKAAPYVAVRTILSDEGAGCDTFGASELECAVRGGVPPHLISLNGSVKDENTIRRGIDLGARIVIDAPREIDLILAQAKDLGKVARIMFRLKPNLKELDAISEFSGGLIRDATQRVRYGLPENEVRALGPIVDREREHLDVVGFHCHIGRHSISMEVWRSLVSNFVELAADLRDEWGWQDWTPVFDFGGGYAPPRNFDTDHHHTGEPAPDIDEYAQAMTDEFRSALSNRFPMEGIGFEIEPGRAMHADTGLHLSEIINIKYSELIDQTWLETNTSEFFVGTWSMDTSTPPFNYYIANRADQPQTQVVDLVGKSCGGEFILVDVPMPRAEVGDIAAFIDTGAYIESLSCSFNAMPRPGIVLVSGSNAEWIKKPETIEQVFERDCVPKHLSSQS